jgi:topoisomerase-4 subunit B
LAQNQQLADLIQALGVGSGSQYRSSDLRYDKVIIMTDADVDGAHIASLLITFFFRQTAKLIEDGHLYIASPPLYRLTQGGKSLYARDDAHKAQLLKSGFTGRGAIEVCRFKGLGEMSMRDLRDTTMDPAKRTLLRVAPVGEDEAATADAVERLMGTRPEARFAFIQERAPNAGELVDI